MSITDTKIGILGGGQLGRMSILEGRRLGVDFVVFEPSKSACASKVADAAYASDYGDEVALDAFASAIDVCTLEFENVPGAAAERVAAKVPLRPGVRALTVCQHRLREKTFLAEAGIPHAPFAVAQTADELPEACAKVGPECVVKTAAFGYDGKGQVKVDDAGRLDAAAVWSALGDPPAAVVEAWIPHQGEVSVVVARGVDGAMTCFPMAENLHRDHILHMSIVPARVSDALRSEGEALAQRVAVALDVVGLIAVEMFITDGGLLVNEMAPRPHNSGHYTLDACATSQFEQHVRAVAGLPLGSAELLSPAVMVNLLGDVWQGGEPNWAELLRDPTIGLHVYDKGEPRPGRKMGHFTVRDADLETALSRAEAAFERLSR